MSRLKWTRFFLWWSVLAWGIGLGAKIFDLLVLAGAWGAAPPTSLEFYPYGGRWPVDPGNFFQPLSAVILIAVVGALISGWRTEARYRFWLWVPVIAFTFIWVATPTLFWPIIIDLYRVANHKVIKDQKEVSALIRHWLLYDWLRVSVIAIGFLSAVRAISVPYLSIVQSNQESSNANVGTTTERQ